MKTLPIEKAMDIKGKKYHLVVNRLIFLRDEYEGKYSIETEYNFFPEAKMFVVKATLKLNGQVYTGHAQEIINDGYINRTSALENCETSAVGRACAMAGIGVIDSIASVEEIRKAQDREQYVQSKPAPSWDDVIETQEKNTLYEADLGVCLKCGAPMQISKSTGKKFCSKKCWLK